MVVTKLRRTLVADADECIVLVGIAIADTSEETNEFAVILITTHPSMVVLVINPRTVTEVVPEEE